MLEAGTDVEARVEEVEMEGKVLAIEKLASVMITVVVDGVVPALAETAAAAALVGGLCSLHTWQQYR